MLYRNHRSIKNLVISGYIGFVSALVSANSVSGLDVHFFDPNVRPQDNLYLAANGEWIKQKKLNSTEAMDGTFKQLFDTTQHRLLKIINTTITKPDTHPETQKIADLYRSFMAEKHLEQLKLTPILPDIERIKQLQNKTQLLQLMGELQSSDVKLPISILVTVDPGNPQRYLASLSQNGTLLPNKSYYVNSQASHQQIRQEFKQYLSQLFTLAGYQQPLPHAENVLNLETKLAAIQWAQIDSRDPQKAYNRITTKQLYVNYHQINWAPFLDYAQLSSIEELNVRQPSYLLKLGALIQQTPLADWQDYLIAHTLDAYALYLHHAVQSAWFNFYGNTLIGISTTQPRWKQGVATVEKSLGHALGKRYAIAHFPENNRKHISALVQNIIQAYQQSLETLSWMEPTTRLKAQEKLSKYSLKIGYPDSWEDYSTLTIRADDLVGNIKRANALKYERAVTRLNQAVDRNKWGMTPQTVNAYYNPAMNEIVFPAAILQPPFFNVKADDAVNYGAIGAIISHEISHGFDNVGRFFDGDGKLTEWWKPSDIARFNELTKRLVNQYNLYEVLPGHHVDGHLTLGENIADNAGLQMAYKAYQLSLKGQAAPVISNMTGDQRFFYGYAQIWRYKIREEALLANLVTNVHAPNEFRAIGSLSNCDAFYNAFDVQPEDKMYLPAEARVRLWD